MPAKPAAVAKTRVETIGPQKGTAQEIFLASDADVCVFGGAAGSGKSFALLIDAARWVHDPGFRAVIFRRTYEEIENPGGLWDASEQIYPKLGGAPTRSDLLWRFPSGAKIQFAHLQHDVNVSSWYGAELTFIGIDECQYFNEMPIVTLMSRNRSMCGVKPYFRMTCLSGDTQVPCGVGAIVPLADLGNMKGITQQSVRISDAFSFTETHSDFSQRKLKKSLRIETRASELLASHDHRFYRWSPNGVEEVRASQLRVGDYLAATRGHPHGCCEMSDEEAYLGGYTAGDGGVTGGAGRPPRLAWSEKDKAHADYVAKCARKVLGSKVSVHKRKSANSFFIYTPCSTAKVRDYVERNKSIVCHQADRMLTYQLTSLNSRGCRSVLQGLFDSEGCVSGGKISWANTSRQLAHQVVVLLGRFGIFCSMNCCGGRTAKSNRVYSISIRGRHAAIFARNVGFRINDKQRKALKIKTKTTRCASDTDVVPICREKIRDLRSLFGKSWWNRNTVVRRDTVEGVLKKARHPHVTGMLEFWNLYAWERVRSIRENGPMVAYDISMPTEHTFFAGNVISHNCNANAEAWISSFVSWWIDQETGYPIPERSGVKRWFVRRGNEMLWGDSAEELYRYIPDNLPVDVDKSRLVKSASFIPAKIYDNPLLLENNPEYLGTLLSMPLVERERLLEGNWKIVASAGQIIQPQWFGVVDEVPADCRLVRAWDIAASERKTVNHKDPDWTVGVLMGEKDNIYYIIDLIRCRVSPAKLERLVVNTAEQDGESVHISMEQDPAAAGKIMVLQFTRLLAGYWFKPLKIENRTKEVRWNGFAGQAEAGNVKLKRAPWNRAFLDEMRDLGSGHSHDDQADAAATGFRALMERRRKGGVVVMPTRRLFY